MILAVCTQTSLAAQEKAAGAQRTAVSVPFVGCKSDGQVGPQGAPSGTRLSVPISPKTSQALAYYKSMGSFGVLAPRGWYCLGIYGSGGDALLVSPQPIDAASIFSTKWDGFAGPAIAVSHRYGDTSGRFRVAEIIARAFPTYKAFATAVMEEIAPARSFTFGPYPKDVLNYKSNRLVEYRTPAQTDGLGTHSWLKKNGTPIEGVAMLLGETPDLVLLSVRLPPELSGLTSVIVRQVERDAERSDRH